MEIKVIQITGKKAGEDDPRLRYIPESFLDDEDVKVLGALEPGGRLVGALAYRVEGFVVRIVYMSVEDIFMRQGVATALINVLEDFVFKDEEGFLLEAYYPDDKEYEAFEKMLLARGDFEIIKNTAFYQASTAKKKNDGLYNKLVGCKGSGERYYSLPAGVRNAFLNKLKYKGINDMEPLWDSREHDRDLSFCKVKNNDVKAAVFIDVYDDEAQIAYMYAESGKDLLGPLALSLKELKKKYPKKQLGFSNLHEGSGILARGLCGEKVSEEKLCVARWIGRID